MKTYVLYHKDTDGFGAAWAAWTSGVLPETTEYIPVNYNEPMPKLEEYSDVYIVDFSYPKDILVDLNEKMCLVVVLDHHYSAQQNLKDLPFCIFDMNKSGAMLSWEYFNPNREIPEIIKYIQDFDLWKFELPESKIINSAINSLPNDFKEWEKYLNPEKIEDLYDQGIIIRNFIENQVFTNIKCGIKTLTLNDLKIGTACIIYPFISDSNEYIHKKLNIDVTMTYYIKENMRVSCSLRSYNNVDVSEIAKKYGGGGHKSASGFEVSIDEFKNLLY